MACGAPVVASDVASLPEVLGEGAELVMAGDVERWSAALRALLGDDDERVALADRGKRWAASFSWDVAAASTLAVYASLGVTV
jgi:glycosyltransferase involved in cell wall biosynthesis